MRTTVNLDDAAAAAVDELRRRDGVGVSEAVNRLIRAGVMRQGPRRRYRHRRADLGLVVDVRNVADALELLDQH